MRRVKTHVLPVLRHIRVAGSLQSAKSFTMTIQYGYSKGISTTMTAAGGITIPPVTDSDRVHTIRYCEFLSNGVITATISTEEGTVASTMRIRTIDQFIA